MVKKAKKQKKQSVAIPKNQTGKSLSLTSRQQDLLFIGIITILLIFLLKPLVIDKLSPAGVDVIAAKGKSHQSVEYMQKSGERALWNPAIFAGMPNYYDFPPLTFSIDTILLWLSRFFSQVFMYYLFAAMGMYLLFRHLKFSPLLAFIGTMIFILMPYYKSFWIEGHYRKFRAVMYIPWILLSFKYFLEKKSLFSIALFAIAFGVQIRTQHYQIVFYTGVLIFAAGVYPFLKDLCQPNTTHTRHLSKKQ